MKVVAAITVNLFTQRDQWGGLQRWGREKIKIVLQVIKKKKKIGTETRRANTSLLAQTEQTDHAVLEKQTNKWTYWPNARASATGTQSEKSSQK